MKKCPLKTHKIFFRMCITLCLGSFALDIVNLVAQYFWGDINDPVHWSFFVFFISGIVFAIISLILLILTPSPETTRVSYEFNFTNFEDCKTYLQNRLKKEFIEHSYIRTKFGYDIFVFSKYSVTTEYYFIVKINHYLGAESINEIPVILWNEYFHGLQNFSLGIQKNNVILCFEEKSDLWFSDFLNIPIGNNNYNRYFLAAVGLKEEQIHIFEYKNLTPIAYYQKMQKKFEDTIGINDGKI